MHWVGREMSVFTAGVGRGEPGAQLKSVQEFVRGGSPVVSVGRTDSHVLATGDSPANETVFGNTFRMG